MKKLLNNEAYYKTFLKCIRMVSNNIVDYLERIKGLYTLIKQEHTGSLSDIAKKCDCHGEPLQTIYLNLNRSVRI